MSRVLITGGAGSLGRELAARLVEEGYGVRALDLPACNFAPLEVLAGVEIVKGSIGDAQLLRHAVADVQGVVHLAALLPPASERDRALTLAVNVEGTRNVIAALEQENPAARLIVSSSVCVYGDTTGDAPPVRVSHPYSAHDIYAESKIAAEQVVLGTALQHTILRVSGISVPAFLEPPAVWPFQAQQRIEFVCRTDVVEALAACLRAPQAGGKVLNIAGGASWRLRGREYVARLNAVMGLDSADARYSAGPGYFDWYDTDESQALLNYQRTPFERFLELLNQAIEAALG